MSQATADFLQKLSQTEPVNRDPLQPPAGTSSRVPSSRRSAMGTVFLLVGIAIVVFLAFSAYSVHKEIQGSAQLAAIKDLHFPVLQRLDANIARLDKIEELYIEVVVTGETDNIDKAADLGQRADQAFVEIAKLNPAATPAINQLRSDLKHYQDLATRTSAALLAKSPAAASLAAGMNAALAAERKTLTAQRNSSYAAFVQTLVDSQQDARVRLYMGLALGVMNLAFMAVLVYFIRNNIKMVDVIARQNATLEQRVTERTAQLSQKTSDINAMLHNMSLGVSTVIRGNLIHPEYSSYLRTLFEDDNLAGRDVLEAFFAHSDLGIDARQQIAAALGSIVDEDPMMFDLNSHLLTREMSISTDERSRKIVQLDWSPIVNERGTVEKVLLITQDVTHLRALEQESAEKKRELDTIARIIKIPAHKFNDFVSSATGLIEANRRLIHDSTSRDAERIASLFRNMHTIKGNARTYEFTHITDAAHHAEQAYDRLRKDDAAEWKPEALNADLNAVASEIARYVRVSEETLGRKGASADPLTTRGAFVSNEQLKNLRILAAHLDELQPDPRLTQLQQAVRQLGLIPLERIASGVADAVTSLARELHKAAPTVTVANADVAFNVAFAEALKSSLMHIVRNSLDHGIETPAERLQANKPERGTISITCDKTREPLTLRIKDDGRGLALHKLYERALTDGAFGPEDHPTPAAIAQLIFRPGVSTAQQVTQISGRGVGMDAVRTFLKEQGATVDILLQPCEGPLAFTPFEFVITVPSSACTPGA